MALNSNDEVAGGRVGTLPRGVGARRAVELLLLFGSGPLLLARWVPPRWLIPVLWGLALAVWLVLRSFPDFDRLRLTTWRGRRREAKPMLLRFGVAAALLAAALAFYRPELLFRFPRDRPLHWGLVMLLYPVISVYPQGLIFRALYQHRYAPIFTSPRWAWVVGALLFSLAHLPFGNGWALGFTAVGGLIFLRTYQRTGSLPLSCLEHALYGQLLFTVGWGAYLYHGGTQALLG